MKKFIKLIKSQKKAHQGQKRYSGEDYITHPVEVSRILAKLHMDQDTIMAALLHDVIEDTDIDKQVLTNMFGPSVADIVDGASKLTQIKFESRIEAQAENFRKMLLAMAKDIRVIILKLADRLHNARSLSILPVEKKKRIAKETLEIYAPIAHRLGMHQFYVEYEDLGFQALYPMRFRIIDSLVKNLRGNRREIIAKAEEEITQSLHKSQIRYHSIHGREKHLYSIFKKMKIKKISFNEIMDVYAVRIIVDTAEDCYRTLGAVHSVFKPFPGRFKDYIAIPKLNSYQSLHTTLLGPYGLPIEVQIRTVEMDKIAENGIAAHWLYKSSSYSADTVQLKAREWLKNLMEIQAETKSPIEFIENVKNDLIPKEVYVFTPQGDILVLPRKATTVDFAYAVHTDIGNSCIAAKINRRLMPLSTELESGQTIEIITAPGTRPNPSWLSFVATPKARAKIREYLKYQKRVEAIDFGKQLLEKELGVFNLSLKKISRDNYAKATEHFNVKSKKTLFAKVGLGNLLPINVARKLVALELNQDELAQQVFLEHEKDKNPLLIKGSQGIIVNIATCCRPIPDDPIIGIFNPGQGLMIHSSQCRHIQKYLAKTGGYLELQWEDDISGEFKTDLSIEVQDQKGVLAKIASSISFSEANIDDINVSSQAGNFNTIHLVLSVKNRVHLATIIRRLRRIKNIIRISRPK